ncbi:MAG TPA: hypothetical protein VN455_10660 [Methanotrichaceae archaeon]|nr:hypothetical protein [Methanotrichaceae archaeon]
MIKAVIKDILLSVVSGLFISVGITSLSAVVITTAYVFIGDVPGAGSFFLMLFAFGIVMPIGLIFAQLGNMTRNEITGDWLWR